MYYFFRGVSLIHTKGLKRFVLVPLSINLLLFSFAFYFLLQQVNAMVAAVQQYLPGWLHWLEYLLIPLGVMTLVIGLAYTFTMIANFIAAPFNGLLSEKVEAHLTGKTLPNVSFAAFMHDVPRMLGREWQKFIYALPRAIILFVLFLFLPVVGPILWFLFTSWLIAIQYCDYPYDNHKIPFHTMRQQLRSQPGNSFAFGITVNIGCMIPLFNLFVMPIAVCGATAMWVDKLAEKNDPALTAPGAKAYNKLDKYC
ncbi:sulfate transporter CysZ [Rheinheimera baltica]|uniref:Sulfate transporter CysZ n=1 Tax=Rheinheimera baltica TaxID=67576 RepID=A0ABT9HXP5_9GAMM|nr:sulfate transporter CysZ [Rheinheimera baltica]MDP5135905.1 sulfate transporter CysZ [Rheinheimera baltica]MDP5141764.1 sulfate transporter CysZ [Rheinheimera baltica]MDP5189437.1 sulfate transporter CysZ [Rheinheimera baltica]